MNSGKIKTQEFVLHEVKGILLFNTVDEISFHFGIDRSAVYKTYFKEENLKKLHALDLQCYLDKRKISKSDICEIVEVYCKAKSMFVDRVGAF